MTTKTYLLYRPIRLLLVFFLAHSILPAYSTTTGNKPVPSNRVLLKFNLKPGDKYLFSSVMKQLTTQEAMGREIKTTQHTTADYLYDVLSVQNGITTINVTFRAMKMDMDISGVKHVSFDSDKPEEAPAELSALKDMVGKSFVMEVNEEGTVQSVKGLVEIMGGAQSPLQQLGFTDSAMTHTMSQMTNIYPNKAVSVGEGWAKALSAPLANLLHMDITATYTLTAISGKTAIVDVKGDIQFSKLKNGATVPVMADADVSLTGTQNGTLELDIESGLPQKMTLKQDISGNLDIQGMKIPMSLQSDTVITGGKL